MLKHVVGLPASDPAWVFFSESDTTLAAKTATPTAPGPVPALNANLASAAGTAHVGLVGVLRGDVDGSYTGGGTHDLDALQPGYFAELKSTYGLEPAQFGVYGAA